MEVVGRIMEVYGGVWASPLFQEYLSLVSSFALGGFLFFALPYTFLANNPTFCKALQKYKVQQNKVEPQNIFWPSLISFIQNALTLAVIQFLTWPLTVRTGLHSGPIEMTLPSLLTLLAQFLFCVVVDDVLFYFSHRLLHSPLLYEKIHKKHHKFKTPTAIAGYYMTPVEFTIDSFIALSGPMILGANIKLVALFLAFRGWDAAEFHSGYEFPWSKWIHLLPFSDGPAFHDFHHKSTYGNYSSFFTFWDHIFGTYSSGYLEYVKQREQKENSKSK